MNDLNLDSNKLNFKTREPIGSSTYPMPSEPIDKNRNQVNDKFQVAPVATEKLSSIYIHIPFCDQICSFCGFNKFISTNDTKEAYVEALIKEMEYYSKLPHIQNMEIGSAYIGGGTPNSLSAPQMDAVLKAMLRLFPFTKDYQATLEGTPQNYTTDKIAVLKANNIQRISAGVQTFNTAIRQEHLNMSYPEEDLLKFIDNIRNNFDDFNLDMIYNLPGQTNEIWRRDLQMALDTNSKHLTIYPLVLLEKTAFYSKYIKQQKISIPSQEKELEQFEITLEMLQKSKFIPHTIRDWYIDKKDCRYIDLNAKCNQVLAFGAGAHGYVAGITYRNERNIKKYIETIDAHGNSLELCKIASKEELMQRFMVMGLRLYVLDMGQFNIRFGTPWQNVFGEKVDTLVANGYLQLNGDLITHTHAGHIWANNIRTYFESKKGASVGYTDSVGVDQTGKGHYDSIFRINAAADVEAHS